MYDILSSIIFYCQEVEYYNQRLISTFPEQKNLVSYFYRRVLE